MDKIWLMGCCLLLGMVGCSSAEATPPPTVPDFSQPPELAPEQVAQGEQVYVVHCASCHGADLEGQPDWKEPNDDGSWKAPPHDQTGHTWHHGDSILVESVRLGGGRLPAEIGASNMPAFEDVLSDAEISAVLVYIKSSWPDEMQEIQWQQTQQEIQQGGLQ